MFFLFEEELMKISEKCGRLLHFAMKSVAIILSMNLTTTMKLGLENFGDLNTSKSTKYNPSILILLQLGTQLAASLVLIKVKEIDQYFYIH